MPFYLKRIAVALAAVGMSACSSLAYNQDKTDAALKPAIERAKQFRPARGVVHDVTGQKHIILAHETQIPDPSKTFSLRVSNARFFDLASTIAKSRGYAVSAMKEVDTQASVNVDFSGLTFDEALRQIGMVAGYVAVINDDSRTVTFAKVGTYTFRVPTVLLQRLSSAGTVGGDPSNSGSGSSSSGSGGGSSAGQSSSSTGSSGGSQGASLTASFVITSETSTPGDTMTTYLERVGGENVQVAINKATGFIFARGNAIALKRIHDFLKIFARDEMRQVQLQASIVDVTLGQEMQYGIKWDKILRANGSSIALDTTSAVTGTAALTGTLTTNSISGVLSALEQVTDVRVVTQPSIVAVNHTPATLFDGRKIPYLPQKTTTVSGSTSSFSSSSETIVYALDGVNISATVDILSNNLVQIRLIPVTNTVGTFQTFDSGNVTAPVQTNKQSDMTVQVPNGQTVIMGGDRYSTANDANNGIPGITDIPVLGKVLGGVNNSHTTRENVMMLQAQILPAPAYEPLVGEAL
ncbi:MSHA biogenesis protein MshL [Robbsia andropogonis]|uniref:type II secretion system protein GspD n=1 Tax=Robbsia andropogonis TaxID=28092 RepID=UPI002A6B1CC0|nr:hypothetical protein [Robbsia andropogonis]